MFTRISLTYAKLNNELIAEVYSSFVSPCAKRKHEEPASAAAAPKLGSPLLTVQTIHTADWGKKVSKGAERTNNKDRGKHR